jgi:hypothetical protein
MAASSKPVSNDKASKANKVDAIDCCIEDVEEINADSMSAGGHSNDEADGENSTADEMEVDKHDSATEYTGSVVAESIEKNDATPAVEEMTGVETIATKTGSAANNMLPFCKGVMA